MKPLDSRSNLMDSVVSDINSSSKPYSVEESREEEVEVNGDGESKSLLQNTKKVVANGGMAKKRQRSSRRRVQWNDRNGNKLVEVLEFQPSDSSDSEDESSSGDRTWKYAIAACIHIFCCHGDQRSSS